MHEDPPRSNVACWKIHHLQLMILPLRYLHFYMGFPFFYVWSPKGPHANWYDFQRILTDSTARKCDIWISTWVIAWQATHGETVAKILCDSLSYGNNILSKDEQNRILQANLFKLSTPRNLDCVCVVKPIQKTDKNYPQGRGLSPWSQVWDLALSSKWSLPQLKTLEGE